MVSRGQAGEEIARGVEDCVGEGDAYRRLDYRENRDVGQGALFLFRCFAGGGELAQATGADDAVLVLGDAFPAEGIAALGADRDGFALAMVVAVHEFFARGRRRRGGRF